MPNYVKNCWSCKHSVSDNDGNSLCIHSKHEEPPGGFIIIDFELATNTCEDYEEVN